MLPDSGGRASKRFRVALSFAGERRGFVAEVAAELARRFGEERILYDKFHEAEFARRDLGIYLPDLYHDHSDLIVVVVCPDYDPKEWCGLEWAAVHDLFKQRLDERVLLCRFERAKVRGLYSEAGFVDLDDKTPALAAVRILERLALNEGKPKGFYLGPEPTPARGAEPLSPPFDPPPAASQFFGRKAEKQKLVERLRAGKNTVVAGFAGLGKTALAAEALREVVGESAAELAESPFPDGVVYLDLYKLQGQATPTWSALANSLQGPIFPDSRPAQERAIEACLGRRILVIFEGGEVADGQDGRATSPELRSVLAPENRWLFLSRPSDQTLGPEVVRLRESLSPSEAGDLLDSLTLGTPLDGRSRQAVLDLLAGHPLALTWAGSLLASELEHAETLVADWRSAPLLGLRDPENAERTLRWLFGRSVRGLDEPAQQALAAAGLLAHAPFPLEVIAAALEGLGTEPPTAVARVALRNLVQRGLLRLTDGVTWQFTHVLGYRFARDEDGSDPALRERLGRWLHARIMEGLAVGASDEARAAVGRLLEYAAAVLRADADQRLWLPLVKALLYEDANRLEALGRLDLMASALDAVEGWLDRFRPEKAQEPSWRRERSVLHNQRGDLLLAQGDLAGALESYRESLAVRRRLAEADPSNAGWQRDLSVSQERIADVQLAQGDLAGALESYRESLAVSRRLAEADPSNAGWQRDLSFILTRLAQVYGKQGVHAEALPLAEESLAIDERLAALDRINVTWQQDVSVSRALVARLRDSE
jgi:tetratricopeptide (TPR) repeat protein